MAFCCKFSSSDLTLPFSLEHLSWHSCHIQDFANTQKVSWTCRPFDQPPISSSLHQFSFLREQPLFSIWIYSFVAHGLFPVALVSLFVGTKKKMDDSLVKIASQLTFREDLYPSPRKANSLLAFSDSDLVSSTVFDIDRLVRVNADTCNGWNQLKHAFVANTQHYLLRCCIQLLV